MPNTAQGKRAVSERSSGRDSMALARSSSLPRRDSALVSASSRAGAGRSLFAHQIVEMIAKLARIAADMARRDAGVKQAFGQTVKA